MPSRVQGEGGFDAMNKNWKADAGGGGGLGGDGIAGGGEGGGGEGGGEGGGLAGQAGEMLGSMKVSSGALLLLMPPKVTL
jgi:hypothetical protein